MDKYIFDGSATDYFSSSIDLSAITGEYTLVWRGSHEPAGAAYSSVFGYGSNEVSWRSNDTILITFGGVSFSGSDVSNDGLIHTYILVADAVNGHVLYEDGVSITPPTTTPVLFASGSLQVGRWSTSQNFTGDLEVSYMFSRAFTTQERTDLDANILDYPSDSQVFICANTKTLATWTDESANATNLTNAGGVELSEAPPPDTTTVEVEWIDSISAAATGNKIYRDDVEIADIGMGVQTYPDDTAETGTTYKYEVQAYSATDETTQEVTGVNTQTITTA